MRQHQGLFAVGLIVALSVVAPLAIDAAPAPDWPWPDWDALETRYPGAPAVLLLDETVSELGYFGDRGVGRKVEVVRVVAILDPARAASWLEGRVPDAPAFGLLGLEAKVWTSPRVNRRLERGDLRDLPLVEGLDARPGRRWRTYRFRDVAPRNVLELRVTHVRPSLFSFDEHFFAHSIPVLRSRARLVVPRHLMSRELGQTVRVFGPVGRPVSQVLPRAQGEVREFAWELRDLDALVEEPFSPSPSEVAPTIWLAPPSPEIPLIGLEAAGRRYFDQVLAPRAEATAEVRALGKRLANGRSGVAERVRAVHAFVRDEVRTTAVGIDLTGFVPEPSASVLAARRGGSLDKALLMMTLLREMGVEARLALMRGRSGGPVDTSFHNLGQFDRAGVWVPLRAGGWWLDPSTPCPPDYLPAEDQGVLALVIGPGVAQLGATPVAPPEASALERRITGSLDSAGTLTGTVELRATGEHRLTLERELWGSAAKPEEVAARLLSEWIGPARLLRFRLAEPRDAGGPFLVTLEFTWGLAAKLDGDTLTLQGNLAALPDWGRAVSAPGRIHPVALAGLEQRRDRLRIRGPEGYSIAPPPEAAIQGAWFSIFVAAERDSARLDVDRMLEISQSSIPTADLGAARDELQRVAQAYAQPARFVRVR
jgi:hypothetical protein